MNRLLATALVAGTLGFAAGNAFWYLASPLWIDVTVSEAAAAETRIVSAGEFRDADSIHRGSGTATIHAEPSGKTFARLSNFKVTNGPDLEVWLVAKADIASSDDVKTSKYVSLGQLKGNIGDQNYSLPNTVNPSDYQTLVIWCEQFGVLFSAASLK